MYVKGPAKMLLCNGCSPNLRCDACDESMSRCDSAGRELSLKVGAFSEAGSTLVDLNFGIHVFILHVYNSAQRLSHM